ncbi:MAG: hypothetical protein R3322_08855, partial [Kiloniellales bacterium]|nr:hypothetical protein [Kiloniellales bacterium]
FVVTMSQKSSLIQFPKSVSQALAAGMDSHGPAWQDLEEPLLLALFYRDRSRPRAGFKGQ